MALSDVDLLSVGIGPSSSPTVGPTRAAATSVGGPDRDSVLAARRRRAPRPAGRGSLAEVARAVPDTGADVSATYEQTSRGGLAVNVIEC